MQQMHCGVLFCIILYLKSDFVFYTMTHVGILKLLFFCCSNDQQSRAVSIRNYQLHDDKQFCIIYCF